ncbi:MAG: tRNA (cytidine(34)-2'-O)-methyltransferase [Lentihominibacter sp.]|jgi:tRNA (cytidine/uridine-2'-O-)-methyltransferase
MAIHIVLVEPEIPPNTGNIARSCAATDSVLHLVKPLGFNIDDKSLKRAGLDYWEYVEVAVYETLGEFMERNESRRMFLATTGGTKTYTDVAYADGDMILFGRETAGLPKDFIAAMEEKSPGCSIRIPMGESTGLRSLNLSNSVAIVMFEALRQMGFPGLK